MTVGLRGILIYITVFVGEEIQLMIGLKIDINSFIIQTFQLSVSVLRTKLCLNLDHISYDFTIRNC